MGRIVELDTDWQTVSAAQDLIECKLDTDQVGILKSVIIMQNSDAASDQAELLQVTTKLGRGNTSGSGGGSATVYSPGGAHSLAGIERNNTTQAVAGGGTLEAIPHLCGAFNVLAGEWERTSTPELQPPGLPSDSFILSISAPADALTLKAIMVVELLVG